MKRYRCNVRTCRTEFQANEHGDLIREEKGRSGCWGKSIPASTAALLVADNDLVEITDEH